MYRHFAALCHDLCSRLPSARIARGECRARCIWRSKRALTAHAQHFALALRKGGVADILEFFPANRRSIGDLTTHFKKAGLPNVADFYQQKRSASVANETLSHLKDMINGDDSQEEVRLAPRH